MRLTGVLFSALLLLAGLGCKPPKLTEVDPLFKRSLHVYFNQLNQDSQMRRDELRRAQAMAEANPALHAPTGTIYSTYIFDENAYVVEDYKCRVCNTNLLLTVPSAEYLCRSCGHCPYKTHPPTTNLKISPCEICIDATNVAKPKAPTEPEMLDAFKSSGAAVRPMFEYVQPDTSKPLEAVVRYVRRQFVFDSRATVQVSQKAIDRAQSSAQYIPVGDSSDAYLRAGFHRKEAEYVGTVKFTFKGGELIQTSTIVEQPVRPWKDLKGNRQ